MSTDILPPGEYGRHEISRAELVNMGIVELGAAEILIREEARRRRLNLTTHLNVITGGLVVEWSSRKRGTDD